MVLGDLLKNTDTVVIAADLEIDVTGISFDTRTLRAGELFVAIKGFEQDGNIFIEEAAAKGAVCVICVKAPGAPIPYVLVEDPRIALATVSAAWFKHPASGLITVGVTGTNGKTTVTSLIKQVIEKCVGAKVGLIVTNSNMIGDRELFTERTTPESYEIQKLLRLMADEGCHYVVMEVSSHALQLGRVHGIEFEVGIFTNLSPDHLDFHSSMNDYADTKIGRAHV